ncbi:MAG: hypothetical protein M1825_004494 [Sarcosagium campestre]|nr:MAG: hypothetical protein M1825_004494 [Sarcosagium campestre]
MLSKAKDLARRPSKLIKRNSQRQSKEVKQKEAEKSRKENRDVGREQLVVTPPYEALPACPFGFGATDTRGSSSKVSVSASASQQQKLLRLGSSATGVSTPPTTVEADVDLESRSRKATLPKNPFEDPESSPSTAPTNSSTEGPFSDRHRIPSSDSDKRKSSAPCSLFPSTHAAAASSSKSKPAPLFCSCADCEDEYISRQQVDAHARMMVGPRTTSDEEDRAEVEVLYARLEKTVQLTKKIQSSLNRLETSGTNVKEAIGPIYGNTQKLQVVGTNIDRVNAAIDKLREPLDIRAKEDRIIRAGPQATGLSEYLNALDRINAALSRLQSTNLRSNQDAIAELSSLFNSGRRQLEDVFRDILKQVSQPVEPLYHITKQKPFPTFSEDKASRLGLICSSVSNSTSQRDNSLGPIAQLYADVRGTYLTTTLTNLAAASINTTKKKSPEALYRRGTNAIGTYATGLESLYLAEYDNICSVFPRDSWGRVFSATVHASLADFSRTLRDLTNHVKSNLMTDCFLAYEVIDIVTILSFNLDKKTGELKTPLLEALKPMRDTAKSSLGHLLDETRRRVSTIQVLPSDGSVAAVTTETMTLLQNMADYPQPLAAVMISLGDGNWSNSKSFSGGGNTTIPKNFDVGADGRQLLAHYTIDTIDALLNALEAKGRSLLKNKSVAGVFLANNVAVVDRMLRSSDLGAIVGSPQRLDFWRKKGVSLYLDAWRDPSAYLLDVQYTNRSGGGNSQRPPSGSSAAAIVNSAEIIKGLNSKDKDSIKEKFRGFNASFDDMAARHRGLAMEREVRSQLAREVQAMIEPLYGRFWDRYHDIDKGKAKANWLLATVETHTATNQTPMAALALPIRAGTRTLLDVDTPYALVF